MSLDVLVEAELARHNWDQIREANGFASDIPKAFVELLNSETPQASSVAYWKLENHVVLQGSLFEAAVYIVPAICAALVDFGRPEWVKIQLLELFFQIVAGEAHSEEAERGLPDLGAACRAEATKGLWLLYRIFQDGELWSAAREVIALIDNNRDRLLVIERINKRHGRIDVEEPLRVT